MIRIDVKRSDLLDRIEATAPGWGKDAKTRTDAAIAMGKVEEGEGTWSKIKEVFIALQHHKCAYCERPMAKTAEGSADKVAVEYDVEHFRPKNRVTAWPSAEVLKRRPGLDYAAKVKAGHASGYVRFAYDPFNYVVSCKVCNSSYKADRFPIAGTSSATLVDRSQLDETEKPLLLFPFGEAGDDPAKYLGFLGPVVRAVASSPEGLLRARTVIDFFELDTREDLMEGRCAVLLLLHPRLVAWKAAQTTAEQEAARTRVEALQADRFQHAACARAFAALYRSDAALAQKFCDAAEAYLLSRDPALLEALKAP